MSDGAFLVLAATCAAVFVIAVLVTNPNPERRNPHTDAHRPPMWHRRKPR